MRFQGHAQLHGPTDSRQRMGTGKQPMLSGQERILEFEGKENKDPASAREKRDLSMCLCMCVPCACVHVVYGLG